MVAIGGGAAVSEAASFLENLSRAPIGLLRRSPVPTSLPGHLLTETVAAKLLTAWTFVKAVRTEATTTRDQDKKGAVPSYRGS